MYNSLIENNEPKFKQAIEYLRNDLATLRTSRATPALVENIVIEAYGSKMSLRELATISAPSPKQILVEPWDKSIVKSIEKGLAESDLGMPIESLGDTLRINLPELSQERREEILKLLHQKLEDTRISVRNIREKIWDEIQDLKKSGEISEDDLYKAKDKLQEVIEKYYKEIDELGEKKGEEVMRV